MGVLLLLSFNMWAQNVNGFLRTDATQIVDGNGDAYILRANGPGGWMLQEGYMFGTQVGTQHEIRAMLEDLTDKATTDAFYESWLEYFFTEEDVALVAEWGFNSIRVPLHYNLFTLPIEEEPVEGENTWLDQGFNILDNLLSWCETHDLYLVLDLHAAPGGQGKNADISDYDPSKPSLWESELNRSKTVALWKKLAERYHDREHIGGYDLINETNWGFDGENENGCSCQINAPLLSLYHDIIDAIREVDTNHIIFIEGNCWANNFSGLESLATYDSNLAFSFHKYWNYNTDATIDGLLQMRTNTNVPLWLGETGENSNTWLTDMVKQMERLEIGWSTWAYKQIDCDDPFTIYSDKWQAITNYNPSTGANRPSKVLAKAAMDDMIEKIKTENCKFNPDVVHALTGSPLGAGRQPYVDHFIPGIIYASDYDMGEIRDAWYDRVYQNFHVSTGEYTAWNEGYAYRNDGVDLEPCSDAITNGFNVAWTDDGEWMRYTVNNVTAGYYDLTFRVASYSSTINLRINSQLVSSDHIVTPQTSGYQVWKNLTVENIYIPEGPVELTLLIVKGGFNLNYIQFEPTQSTFINPDEKIGEAHIERVMTKDGLLEVQIVNNDAQPLFVEAVEIYDLQGRMLISKKCSRLISNQGLIALENPLSKGFYILKVRANNPIESKSFIV